MVLIALDTNKRIGRIKKAAEEGSKVLFPLGVIEEHGPHLPLGSNIFWSNKMCELVRDELRKNGKEALIVPGYYWGINYCTGAFPGSFSLRPETMKQVLFEIFENNNKFGFSEVYCFNYHGDSYHVNTIVEAMQKANLELGMNVKLVLESMDLQLYHWQGDEDFLLISSPPYPFEWFEEEGGTEKGLFDIHGGAFETAVMNYFYPEFVDLQLARTLESSSLTMSVLQKWLEGGDTTKAIVLLGYAGNPAGYEVVGKYVKEMIALQVSDIARRIMSL